LPVVAEQAKLAVAEDTVQVVQHLGTDEVLEGLHVVIEAREDDAAAAGYPQTVETVLRKLEVRRHAAVDPSVLPYAAPERQPDQVALEVVVPLVIRADEILHGAVPFAAERDAAVRAAVLHHGDVALLVAHHDDAALAHHRALEVADLGDLAFE